MALSPNLAAWLRSEGHDAVHASDLALDRAPDTQILATAVADGRIVITADLDFPRLLAALSTKGPGLILLRGGNYTEAESLQCVRRVLMALPPKELAESLVVVDQKRIRRRWLPV
jgi:predicted nuclease of predicted toxin-antitoxin system